MLMLVGIGIGMLILLVVAFVVFKLLDQEEVKNVSDVYIGRLENTDSSIQNALKHLELKNGIMQNFMEKQ